MRIVEVVKIGGKQMATCMGNDIQHGMKCSKIRIGGKTFDVLNCYAKETFTQGVMAAYLGFDIHDNIPTGEIEIIS